MEKPHYSFFTLHPYHLDTAMTFYFPEQNYHLFSDAKHSWYTDICSVLEILLGKFPNVSMRDIEEYCEVTLDYLPQVAKDLGIDYQNEFHNCQLLDAIIYANINKEFIEVWKSRLSDKKLRDMAIALRGDIHEENEAEYDAWNEAHNNLISDLAQSEMDDTDSTWRIANDLG